MLGFIELLEAILDMIYYSLFRVQLIPSPVLKAIDSIGFPSVDGFNMEECSVPITLKLLV